MTEFELHYGKDKVDDYLGETRMLNLKNVRDKNYMSILTMTNDKTRGSPFMKNRSFRISGSKDKVPLGDYKKLERSFN